MALSCGKKLRALLKEIASKHHSDFYCLNFFHYFRTENKLKSYKKVCENNFFCNILMSSEDTKILGFNQCQKSDKASFIIYADLECLIEMSNACKENPESSSTTKYVNKFHEVFQFLQYPYLRSKKITTMYTDCVKVL